LIVPHADGIFFPPVGILGALFDLLLLGRFSGVAPVRLPVHPYPVSQGSSVVSSNSFFFFFFFWVVFSASSSFKRVLFAVSPPFEFP